MTKRTRRKSIRGDPSHGPPGKARGASPLDILGPILVVAAAFSGAVLFLTREQAIAGSWGFSLDDSWIHAAFARNIATGHGFAFNPDEPVAGSTGPLYSLILAALYRITMEMVWSAKAFGIICQVASALFIYRAAQRMNPSNAPAAIICGLLVALSPSLTWASVSGMEISLYLLFVCAGIYLYVSGRDIGAASVWSAGVWVRPDGLFLVLLSLLGPRSHVKRKLVVIAPIIAGYLAFNWVVGHTPLPLTVGTKAHFGFQLAARSMNLLREWGALWGIPYRFNDELEHPALLFPLMIIGAVLTARKRPLLALYWIGLPLAFSLFRENSASHKRYIVYVVPFGMLLATSGAVFLSRRFVPRAASTAVVALGVVCLAWQVACLDRKATTHGWNVQNINGMEITLGKIAAQLTEPGATVGASDIGAMGYFSGRRVVDLMGLVNKMRPLPENLSLYRPAVIVVDMEWFREYARHDSASNYFAFYDADSSSKYTALGGVELLHNTICSTNQMIMFRRQGLNDPPVAEKFRLQF